MSKFARSRKPANVTAPVKTIGRTMTHEGALGYERDEKSELYLLAVSNMVGQATFYEPGHARDSRYVSLIHRVTKADPDWIARFVPFLRDTMNMRSASLVMAAEYVAAGGPHGRAVIASALKRPDEPAEMLAYWQQEHGRTIPKPVKRGVADAVRHLYTERAVLKYDGKGGPWRMGDVVELTHPKPRDHVQNALFRYLIDRRHNRDNPRRDNLHVIDEVLDWEKMGTPLDKIPAGMTWERMSSFMKMDKDAWEAIIPRMGYMALLRNLRNFDEAGVSDQVADAVSGLLSNPEAVALSKQFPIRFFSAYASLNSLRWGPALERALNHSLNNVPALKGRTLILVDVSGSMMGGYGRSRVESWQLAALFGSALALRAENPDLHAYSNGSAKIVAKPGAAILKYIPEFIKWRGARGGTETYATLQALYNGHDRVVILTDEQAFGPGRTAMRGYLTGDIEPPNFSHIPLIYTFNLNGYRQGHQPSGEKGRYTFGGLTDAGFRAIELLEAGRDQDWPF